MVTLSHPMGLSLIGDSLLETPKTIRTAVVHSRFYRERATAVRIEDS